MKLEDIEDGDYVVAKNSFGEEFVLDRINLARKIAYPVALMNVSGWSYTDESGDYVLDAIGTIPFDEEYIENSSPRKVSKEELAFILLQCEENNET